MAEAAIPVDLFNPGQVFACVGLVEVADVLFGDAEGVFDWSDPVHVLFRVRSAGETSPVERALAFLDGAEARALAPQGSRTLESWNDSWGPRPELLDQRRGYPCPDPASPATLVCELSDGRQAVLIDHWSDATERDNVKFWAGAGGYPGAALARDALALVRGRAAAACADPFALCAPQSSSFRFDWRRDYIPIDAGFSLNAHGNLYTLGFPLVELLAAIGLGHARPKRPDRRDKLVYEYAVMGRERTDDSTWLPLPLLRAALGATAFPFPMRRFRMLLDWPGKEGQARSITTVTEENIE
ncbi:MAG TPA: type I-U CRISPR-associated protein Cas8c [Burkholderiaceae bacterium]|jgi:CRISPR-associated protein Csx14|nr:type I-U CRISPR-associated protein Cas8c [Burkholderiaceae bacterium]